MEKATILFENGEKINILIRAREMKKFKKEKKHESFWAKLFK
jgi:siroheme synthase (precorrin-2 oxidase/ferrochelatase)